MLKIKNTRQKYIFSVFAKRFVLLSNMILTIITSIFVFAVVVQQIVFYAIVKRKNRILKSVIKRNENLIKANAQFIKHDDRETKRDKNRSGDHSGNDGKSSGAK